MPDDTSPQNAEQDWSDFIPDENPQEWQGFIPDDEVTPLQRLKRGLVGGASRFNETVGNLLNVPNRLMAPLGVPPTNPLGNAMLDLAKAGRETQAEIAPPPTTTMGKIGEFGAGLPIDLAKMWMIASAAPAGVAGMLGTFGTEAGLETAGAGGGVGDVAKQEALAAASVAGFKGAEKLAAPIANPLLRAGARALGTGAASEVAGIAGGQTPQEALPEAITWGAFGALAGEKPKLSDTVKALRDAGVTEGVVSKAKEIVATPPEERLPKIHEAIGFIPDETPTDSAMRQITEGAGPVQEHGPEFNVIPPEEGQTSQTAQTLRDGKVAVESDVSKIPGDGFRINDIAADPRYASLGDAGNHIVETAKRLGGAWTYQEGQLYSEQGQKLLNAVSKAHPDVVPPEQVAKMNEAMRAVDERAKQPQEVVPVANTQPRPTFSSPEIESAWNQVMGTLPPEIQRDVTVRHVGIYRFPNDLEGSDGILTKSKNGHIIRIEEGNDELLDTLKHEILHSYQLNHPELADAIDPHVRDYERNEKALRALEKQIKEGQPQVIPVNGEELRATPQGKDFTDIATPKSPTGKAMGLPPGKVLVDETNANPAEKPLIEDQARSEAAAEVKGATYEKGLDVGNVLRQREQEQMQPGNASKQLKSYPSYIKEVLPMEEDGTVLGVPIPEDMQVDVVRGAAIRGTDQGKNFIQGGNPLASPLVPDGHFALDDSLPPEERAAVLTHEVAEWKAMHDLKKDYPDAHENVANVAEQQVRHGAAPTEAIQSAMAGEGPQNLAGAAIPPPGDGATPPPGKPPTEPPSASGGQPPIPPDENPNLSPMQRLTEQAKQLKARTESIPTPPAPPPEGPGRLAQMAERIKSGAQRAWQGYSSAPDWTPADQLVGEYLKTKTIGKAESLQHADAINETIKDPTVQKALHFYAQAGGDQAQLQTWLDTFGQNMRPEDRTALEHSMHLTPEEQGYAKQVADYHDSLLGQLKATGAVAPETGRENFVSQIWDQPKGSGTGAGKRYDPTKQRTINSTAEGLGLGLTGDYRIGRSVALYGEAAAQKMAETNLRDGLKSTDAADGRKLAVPITEGRAPDGYQKGVGPLADLYLHPEIADRLNNQFGSSAIRKAAVGRALLDFQRNIKDTMTVVSQFHPVQLAIHAGEHLIHPTHLFGAESFIDPMRLAKIDYSNDPRQAKLLVGSYTPLGLGDVRSAFEEGLGGGAGVFKYIPKVGKAAEAYTSGMWKLADRIKMTTALHMVDNNTRRFGGKLSEAQIYRMSAEQANAAFGGQNMDFLGKNKTLHDLLRLGTFAPDFLISRAKFVGQGLTPYGTEQRAALLRGAIAMYVGARIANAAFNNGDPKMDPKDMFSVVVGGRRYGFRTVQGDVLHAATDLQSFAYNRLNPVFTRPALEAISGRDQYGRPVSAANVAVNTAFGWTPIMLQNFLKEFGTQVLNKQTGQIDNTDPLEKLYNGLLQNVGIQSQRERPVGSSSAEKYLADYYKGSVFPLTPKQRLVSTLAGRLRAGENVTHNLAVNVSKGFLSAADLADIARKSQEDKFVGGFTRLPDVEHKIKMFSLSTPEQRTKLASHLTTAISNALKRDPSQADAIRQMLLSSLGGSQ